MKIIIGSDHAAFEAKEMLKQYLSSKYEVLDVGTFSSESTHYPEWAKKLVTKVLSENTYGVLLCGSGIGVSIVANRFQGIRAALCRDVDDAKMARLHNNANVICLSGRKSSTVDLKSMVDTFLQSPFEGGRHQERIDQFNKLGEESPY